MVAATLVDLVKVNISSAGTGAFVLGAAVYGFRGTEALIDGAVYPYAVQQRGEYETGVGSWVAGSSTLTRSPQHSSNGNAPVAFGANAELCFVARADDITGQYDVQEAIDAANEAAASAAAAALSAAEAEAAYASLGGTGGASLVGAADGASGTLWTTVQGFTNKLLSSSGATVIGYILAATGSTSRTIQGKLSDLPASAFDFGATGTFEDATTAFTKLRDWMDSQSHDMGGLTEPKSLIRGRIPAGAYQVTASEALMNGSFLTKRQGYAIRGDGAGYTEVFFNPSTGSRYLAYNRARQAIVFSGMTVTSDNAANGFFQSYAENSLGRTPQDFEFKDMAFGGQWGSVFKAFGDGNNSEWTFTRCRAGGPGYSTQFGMGEFLEFPSSASDQQVNVTFDQCFIWPESADTATRFLKLAKGGSIHVRNSDFSGWQAGTVFEVTTQSSQFNMEVVGTRFEQKTNLTKIMTCTVTGGLVSFRDCNFAVNAPQITDLTQITFDFTTGNGPDIVFDNCDMQGVLRFNQRGAESRRYRQTVSLRNLRWQQYYDIFDATNPAIKFVSSGQYGGLQPVVLEGCGGSQAAITSSLWAATTAYALNAKIRLGLSEYICTVAGTSGGTAPTPVKANISEGTVTWAYVRNEPRCYANDVVLNGAGTQSPDGVKRRTVLFANTDGVLPPSGDYCEVIVPPNVVVVEAGIFFPPNGTGIGTNSTAFPTWKLATDDASQTFADNTSSTTAANLGCNVVWTGKFWTGTGIRRRAIKLTSTGTPPTNASASAGCRAYIVYEG